MSITVLAPGDVEPRNRAMSREDRKVILASFIGTMLE